MEDELVVYHVEAHKRGWQVRKRGAKKASRVKKEKNEAIKAARGPIGDNRPAQLIIHGRQGKQLNTIEFEDKQQVKVQA